MKIRHLLFPICLLVPLAATLKAAEPFPRVVICAVETNAPGPGQGSSTAITFSLPDSPLSREIRHRCQTSKITNSGTLLRMLGTMPEADHSIVSADLLIANHTAAFAARSAHSWAENVPFEVFRNDVLPYACIDETRENWRPDFRNRFAPLVAKSKTLREAALIINQRIRDELKVEYSTKRKKANQSPSESIAQGMASCTGLSILLCDAFRAVGIPARLVGTSWKHKSGNHTWVEFYDPATRQWHFTEYYPDQKGIDHGWLVADAAHAVAGDPHHAVYATSWNATGRSFPLPWAPAHKSVHAIDVTARYHNYAKATATPAQGTIELRIDFRDAHGNRIPVKTEVRDGDQVIASGTTPGPTRDANDFLTIHIPRTAKPIVVFAQREPVRLAPPAPDQNWIRIEGK